MATGIPAELVDLLTTDVVGHLATVRSDGSLAPAIVWVDFEDAHVLVDSPVGSRKGVNIRANPQVALSVVDHQNPWRFLQIRGHVTGIRPDEGLAKIDELSGRYTGGPYRWRDRAREIFEITIDNVHASTGRR